MIVASALLPRAASAHAGSIDALFTTIFWITVVALLVVEVTLVVFLVRYRRSRQGAVSASDGNAKLEIGWAALSLAIFLAIAGVSGKVWSDVKGDLYQVRQSDDEAFHVRVEPAQFLWTVTYPGSDAVLGTADDVVVMNELRVPVDREVVVDLRSADVIHSFFIPEMRVKQDALPGATSRVRFTPIRKGSYEVVCAELCGLGHYRMRASVIVDDDAAIRRWLDEQAGLQ